MTIPRGKYFYTIILQLDCEWTGLLLVTQRKEWSFQKDGVRFLAPELAEIPYA